MGRKTEVNSKLKALQGHSRFIKNVPDVKPILKIWPAPADLGEAGRSLWLNQGPLLVKAKVLTDLDEPLFKLLCRSLDILDMTDKTLAAEGLTVMSKAATKAHPAIKLRGEAVAHVLALSARFGLTPYDRTKIDLRVDAEPDDDFRKFLQRKNK
jgi:P27 family predicted phage terminase small subunit